MKTSIQRRTLLIGASVLPLASACSALASPSSTDRQLAALERASGGRLGVSVLHTGSGARVQYRGGERFPMCSTFKLMLSACVLEHSTKEGGLLARRIRYAQGDIIANSPISGRNVAQGMTVAALCAATVQYSDNAAANLLMKMLGGPAEVTAFARRIGDDSFRLDRWETELNTAIPGDLRDTTTPDAMTASVDRLVLGDALGAPQREQLKAWLLGNTTGAERIAAGLPAGWKVGDKTGTGSYGAANDTGVAWPPSGAPLVVTVYQHYPQQDTPARSDVIAAATRIAAGALAG